MIWLDFLFMICRQRGRMGKGFVFTTTLIKWGLGSTLILVTLLRPWIRRLSLLDGFEQAANSADKNSKKFTEILRNIGSSKTPKQVRIPPITK